MNEGEAESQVPLLGDIPWLGELFKNRSRSRGRTKFYVFIRPTITRGDGFEYLKYVSQDMAEDLGVDDGFPVVKPRVIR
jgi:type II secretory pathway component GspD/PulD (secretin)